MRYSLLKNVIEAGCLTGSNVLSIKSVTIGVNIVVFIRYWIDG